MKYLLTASSKLSLALKQDIVEVRQDLTVITQTVSHLQLDHYSKNEMEMLDWISGETFSGRQNDIFESMTHGTCSWVHEVGEFRAWLSSNNGSLFFDGMPGCGKTVLASFVVNYLQNAYATENIGIANVYCSYKEVGQLPGCLEASLLRQLLQQGLGMTPEIIALHKRHSISHTRLALADVTRLLQIATQTFSKTFIVIDALDEYEEMDRTRDSFIASLKTIQPHVNLLLTSRRVPAIENEFEAPKVEIRANEADINKYVRTCTHTMSRLKRHLSADTSLEELIVTRVVDSCHGMFLLAKLHMDSLQRQPHRKAVRSALENLPKELNDTFHDAMLRIQNQDQESVKLAHNVLAWTVNTYRPLTMREMQHALAIQPNYFEHDEEAIIDDDLIISVCLGLVTKDRTITELRLIHYSAQKYLENWHLSLIPNPHQLIASACLTYLSYQFYSDSEVVPNLSVFDGILRKYALLDYAAYN